MPTYEYRCRVCTDTFELRRPMADADEPAPCPAGHVDTTRLLSVFAAVSSGTDAASPREAGVPCGAHCACHPG